MWVSEGYLSDPISGQLLADTGAIPAGTMSITILIWADGGIKVRLHQRNALNTADIHSQLLPIIGTQAHVGIPFTFLVNQRLTLTCEEGFTGNVEASLLG